MFAALAATAAAAVIVTVAAVWPGLDAQQTPPVDTGVWALQTADGRRYARVNTGLGELDTVRGVSNPSSVVQSSDGVFLFSESFGKVTRIDEAMPLDLDEEATRSSQRTPAGTVEVAVAGDFVAYRTDSGAVFAGRLSSGEPTQLDPHSADEDAPHYTAEAITVDSSGVVYSYSSIEKAVLSYRITSSEVIANDVIDNAPTGADLRITALGGRWLVVDPADDGRVWMRERSMALRTIGAVAVQRPGPEADVAYVADEAGLMEIPLDGGLPKREFGDGVRVIGQPARPTPCRSVRCAA